MYKKLVKREKREERIKINTNAIDVASSVIQKNRVARKVHYALENVVCINRFIVIPEIC